MVSTTVLVILQEVSLRQDPSRGRGQVGSLAGAAHPLNGNAGVPRRAQRGRKPRVERKGKSSLDSGVQHAHEPRKRGLSILWNLSSGREARGVGKVTTGITGSWRPSVHSDVAF